jgi:nucleotide-binding universal stress UspA family protein
MNWLPRQTVVVPIDFSDDSFAALDTAREMVDDPSHLHVIHVLPVLEANDPGVIWDLIDDESRSQHAAEALRKELTARGHDGPQVAICFGDAGHQIAQYAEQIEAGLIIVSSRGQSGLSRLLIGSVAERVVRLAHCPVLVLKR